MNSLNNEHLSQDLIFRTVDDELTSAERFECEAHLAVCEACRRELAALREFSSRIEVAVQSVPIPEIGTGRRDLQTAIEGRRSKTALSLQPPGRVMRRFGWGMAIAATLALGVLIAPRHESLVPQIASGEAAVHEASAAQPAMLEVEGETFLPVPYSNADLPITAPHIVQMQVPISSLADVGIVLEPVTNRVSGQDNEGSVLADVLVGADGQPRGVHVLGAD